MTTTARALLFLFSMLTVACSEQCEKESASEAPIVDDGDYHDAAPKGGCCLTPSTPSLKLELCMTHPFGRKIGCGGIEEPQTSENCQDVLRLNDDICTSDYIACRDAIRLAACDVCPAECDGVDGAC
jgi:hypothetical protein